MKQIDYSKPVMTLMSLFNPQDKEWMMPAFENMITCLDKGNEPTSNPVKIKFRVFMLFYRKMLIDTNRATPDDFGGSKKFMYATTDELLNHARAVFKQIA